MRYWTGLLIAVAFDAAVIAGPAYLGTKPQPAQPESLSFAELQQVDRSVDSLMQYLQENPGNVDAMLAIARIYTEHGWAGDAIGPLARALRLDPYRRDLWVALDRALDKMGKDQITDAELARAALEFASAFEGPRVAFGTRLGYIFGLGGAPYDESRPARVARRSGRRSESR